MSESDAVGPERSNPVSDQHFDAIRMRLLRSIDSYSYSEIARDTGIDEQTIRRSLTTDPPSKELIAAVCDVYMIDEDWLVCGRAAPLSILRVRGSDREELGRQGQEPGPDITDDTKAGDE